MVHWSTRKADERAQRAKSRASSRAISRSESRGAQHRSSGSRSPSPVRWKSPSALESRGDPTPVKYKCFDMRHATNDLTTAVAESFSRGGIASRGNKQTEVDPLLAKKMANRMKYEIDIGFNLELPHGPTRFNPNQSTQATVSPPQAAIAGASNFEVFKFEDGGEGATLPALNEEMGFNGTLGFNNTAHGSAGLGTNGAMGTGISHARLAAKAAAAESRSPIPPGDPGRKLVKTSQTVKPVSFDKLRNSCSSSHTVVRVGKNQLTQVKPFDHLPSLRSSNRLSRPDWKSSAREEDSRSPNPGKDAHKEGSNEEPIQPEMKFERDTFLKMQMERNKKRRDSKAGSIQPSPFVAKTQQAIKEAAEQEDEEPAMSRMESLLTDALNHVEVPEKIFTFPTLNSVPQLKHPNSVVRQKNRNKGRISQSRGNSQSQSLLAESPSASRHTQAPDLTSMSQVEESTSTFIATEMPRPSTVMSRMMEENTSRPLPVEVLDVGRYTPQSTIDRMESRFTVDVIRSHSSMF